MSKGKKLYWFIGIMIVFILCGCSAFAKEAYQSIPSTSVKNVAKAPVVTGQWTGTDAAAKFKNDKGTVLKNQWFQYNGKIYYVDAKGKKVTGLLKYRKKLYFVSANGAAAGWKKIGKNKYYFGNDYAAVSGLTVIDGNTYYFDKKTCVNKTGLIKIGKYKYYFIAATGAMAKNEWVKSNGGYLFVNEKGRVVKSSWITVGTKKYYVDSDGLRVSGNTYIKGKWYYFDNQGVYDPTKKVTSKVNPKQKMVALTFDDGPGAYTATLLNTLQANKGRATFFMVGQNVGSHKSEIKKMLQLGCELGNHSWSHPNMASLSTGAIESQISRTNTAIKSACGKQPTVCRLPYGSGATSSRVLNALGLPSIYWSVDTRDWANTGNSGSTVSAVLNHVKNGDIILMHDIHRATVSACQTIIPSLVKRGYQLVTVSELAEFKGKAKLRTGKTYYNF